MSLSATLHYRCMFELEPRFDEAEAWSNVVKTIRYWISKREETNDAFGGQWMYVGGQWKGTHQPRLLVQTAAAVGNGTIEAPQHWAIRYEKPCSQISFRQWRTDIGIGRLPGGLFGISLATNHWLLPGYLGDEPPIPEPSAPGVLKLLLGSNEWVAFAGTQKLTAAPAELSVGSGMTFREILEDPGRSCPIVYVSKDSHTGNLLLDTHRLSNLLAGGASVFEAQEVDVSRELSYILPHKYQCRDGMVRIYQPRLNFDLPFDYQRHRFVTREHILERSPVTVEDMIIRSVARRPVLRATGQVTTVEDVQAKIRDFRLAELGNSKDAASLQERVNLLYELNTQLHENVTRLTTEKDGAEEQCLELMIQVDQKDDENRTLRYQCDADRAARVQSDAAVRRIEKQLAALANLASLPENLEEAVSLIERLHADRILFLDEAKASAREAGINSSKSEIWKVWRCLWAVATTLHELHFREEGQSLDIESVFQERTGFKLALTEGGQTKADKKLMKHRTLLYQGREIDITPHVKFGREPRLLRIHYCPDHDTGRLLVGHCGDHLETAGSRYR